MKKILCVTLSLLLMFNTTVVYADIHGGSSGSFDITPTPSYSIPSDMLDENGHLKPPSILEFLDKTLIAGLASSVSPELGSVLYGFIGDDFLKNYDNSDDSISLEDGGSTVHFHDTFTNKFNAAIQDKIHAYDGYWLVEPTSQESPAYRRVNYDMSDEQYNAFLDGINGYTTLVGNGASCAVLDNNYFVYARSYTYSYSTYHVLAMYSVKDNQKETDHYLYWDSSKKTYSFVGSSKSFISPPFDYRESFDKLTAYVATLSAKAYGQPFKVFYSYDALINYLLNNQQRSYVPKLPSGGFKVNIKYINNTTNLPDITYNITTENKTEFEIQNQYDTTINNYLESLDDFSSGGDDKPVTPTPTPIISDGQPTPTPVISDGSLTPTPPPTNVDLTETNNWLEKIYNWLEEFGKSHDKFTKDLSDYLETHKGKLEDIIKALDKIADGMEKGEDNGCKYDYSELSDFMKELWNESDKKFDTMIDLLETNNEYQKKLVKSLNEIKAILVTQTVLELFQNRSEETANEAKEKFPTSIPWDIAMVLNAMAADPKPLKVELPIKIESFKINESITVDLTGKEWEQLATTCRYLLSITFILYLIHLSRKLFSKGDDD